KLDIQNDPLTAHCWASDLCLAPAGFGVVSTTNPTFGPATWDTTDVDVPHYDATGADHTITVVDCASRTLCLALDASGFAMVGRATAPHNEVAPVISGQSAVGQSVTC